MRTVAYKADVAGTGMWQDTFFVSCRKPTKKTAHEDGYDGIRGDRIGDVGKYIQKTKMKIMLFGNGFFRKKDINSTYD